MTGEPSPTDSELTSAQRISNATRALESALLQRLALDSDALMEELASRHALVPWDRESLVGGVQRRVRALFERRAELDPGPTVRIVERSNQPFESLVAALRVLRRGRRVALEVEPGASERPLQFLLGSLEGTCRDAVRAATAADAELECRGVDVGHARVALVQADGDLELAAYVLARGALRRGGLDPRGLHLAVVAGTRTVLERHLRRLWSGVKLGPPDDPSSFAGPLPSHLADTYLEDWMQLSSHPHLRTVVAGGALHVAADPKGSYLAPALFRWASPLHDLAELDALLGRPGGLAIRGPTLVLVPVPVERAEEVFERLASGERRRTRIGELPKGQAMRIGERVYTGALLIERLPPGLPEPRP